MEKTYVIAGLGNPGEQYHLTRHNAGFLAVDNIREKLRLTSPAELIAGGALWKCIHRGIELFLFKPLSFMNSSGKPVKQLLDKYSLSPESLIVLHDDMDIPPGRVKVKKGGSAAGHRGVESVIAELNTDEFIRIRIGIGRRPPGVDGAEYVLQVPEGEEMEEFMEGIKTGAEAALYTVEYGVERAMNQFNKKSSQEVQK